VSTSVDRIVIAGLELHFQFELRLRLHGRRSSSIIVAANFRVASPKYSEFASSRSIEQATLSMVVTPDEHRHHAYREWVSRVMSMGIARSALTLHGRVSASRTVSISIARHEH